MKSWTALVFTCLALCLAENMILLILENYDFFPATIIYDIAGLFTPGLMVSYFEAIFVLLHCYDTLRGPSLKYWATNTEAGCFGETPPHWRHSAVSKVKILPQTWSNFSRDLRPQLVVTFRYSRRTIHQLANRKMRFLQKVGLDSLLLSGVDGIYIVQWKCIILGCLQKESIYLHFFPFPELPWQDLCLNYWKEAWSNVGGFSFIVIFILTFAVLWFDSFVWFAARLPSGLTCMLLYLF